MNIVTKEKKKKTRRRRSPGGPLKPGEALRGAREAARLSQAQVALRMGCTQQAVAQAERRNSNPTIAYMSRFARACGRRLRVEFR